MREVSEQTQYTIACDIAQFKEYAPGEIIVNQDLNSQYNLYYLQNERVAITNLEDNIRGNKDLKRKLDRAVNPTIRTLW
jgi:hypothetical protein